MQTAAQSARPNTISIGHPLFLFLLILSPMMGLGCSTSNIQQESLSEFYWQALTLRQQADNTPEGTEALRDLGVIYLRTGYYQDAYDALSRSLVQDRADPKRWFYSGLSLELLGRPAPALATYERFLSLSSSSIYTRAMRGRVAWLAGVIADRDYESLLRRDSAPPSDSLNRNTYAVFPLSCGDNFPLGGDLGLGISEIVSRDIEQLRNVDMIDPQSVRRAHAITLQLTPKEGMTRPEWTGRMLGAGKIVGGSCNLSDTGLLQIDLVVQDLIDSQTYFVSGSASIDAISSLEKQLVRDLADKLRIWIPDRPGADPNRVPEFEAIATFSEGLAYEDADMVEESLASFDRALAIDPNFTLAELRRQHVANKILARASSEQDFINLLLALEADISQEDLLGSVLVLMGQSLGAGFVPGQDSRKQPPTNVGELPAPPTPVRN